MANFFKDRFDAYNLPREDLVLYYSFTGSGDSNVVDDSFNYSNDGQIYTGVGGGGGLGEFWERSGDGHFAGKYIVRGNTAQTLSTGIRNFCAFFIYEKTGAGWCNILGTLDEVGSNYSGFTFGLDSNDQPFIYGKGSGGSNAENFYHRFEGFNVGKKNAFVLTKAGNQFSLKTYDYISDEFRESGNLVVDSEVITESNYLSLGGDLEYELASDRPDSMGSGLLQGYMDEFAIMKSIPPANVQKKLVRDIFPFASQSLNTTSEVTYDTMQLQSLGIDPYEGEAISTGEALFELWGTGLLEQMFPVMQTRGFIKGVYTGTYSGGSYITTMSYETYDFYGDKAGNPVGGTGFDLTVNTIPGNGTVYSVGDFSISWDAEENYMLTATHDADMTGGNGVGFATPKLAQRTYERREAVVSTPTGDASGYFIDFKYQGVYIPKGSKLLNFNGPIYGRDIPIDPVNWAREISWSPVYGTYKAPERIQLPFGGNTIYLDGRSLTSGAGYTQNTEGLFTLIGVTGSEDQILHYYNQSAAPSYSYSEILVNLNTGFYKMTGTFVSSGLNYYGVYEFFGILEGASHDWFPNNREFVIPVTSNSKLWDRGPALPSGLTGVKDRLWA